jgi:hypothetical protein
MKSKMISLLPVEDSLRMDTFKINGNDVWFSPVYNKNPIILFKRKITLANTG